MLAFTGVPLMNSVERGRQLIQCWSPWTLDVDALGPLFPREWHIWIACAVRCACIHWCHCHRFIYRPKAEKSQQIILRSKSTSRFLSSYTLHIRLPQKWDGRRFKKAKKEKKKTGKLITSWPTITTKCVRNYERFSARAQCRHRRRRRRRRRRRQRNNNSQGRIVS